MADKDTGLIAYLKSHRQLLPRADAALKETVQAVIDHNKPGEVTIKIKFKPEGHRQMAVGVDVTNKAPRPGVPTSIFFGDTRGRLHRSDPGQSSLSFMEDEAGEDDGEPAGVN